MFLLPQERDSFLVKLEDTENWLYEEGEDEKKQVYIDRLAALTVSAKFVLVSCLSVHHDFLLDCRK